MNIHEDRKLFSEAIHAASETLGIHPVFVEKDYWITRSLRLMAESPYAQMAIFKGGTSLSKAYRTGNRFSEDIDIAILGAADMNGNQTKTIMKKIAKQMSSGLEEIDAPRVTSKGSRYYKAVYSYPRPQGIKSPGAIGAGRLLGEINTFANPYPFERKSVDCFIYRFLSGIGEQALIEKHSLTPFIVNVLDKRQTLTEKVASLIRFSLSQHCIHDLASKIRHFYDIFYLLQDDECAKYLQSGQFSADLHALLEHDRASMDNPAGWNEKQLGTSPLLTDFPTLRDKLKRTYTKELSQVAYSSVPGETDVARRFAEVVKRI